MKTTKYWQEERETMPREELEKFQLERLKQTIKQAANSPFYHQVFEERGITPDSFQSLDDLRKLPFTTKDDLRSHYPFGVAAIPLQKCVRIHSSSGTTGNPTVVLHSAKDLDQWANQVARCMYMVGLRDADVFQNTSGYGMFTGGLGFQYGAERLGALTVPAAAGNTKRQIKFITDFGTTCLHIIPSYATRLAHRPAQGHETTYRMHRGRASLRGTTQTHRATAGRQGLQLLRYVRDERAGRGIRVPGTERLAYLGR